VEWQWRRILGRCILVESALVIRSWVSWGEERDVLGLQEKKRPHCSPPNHKSIEEVDSTLAQCRACQIRTGVHWEVVRGRVTVSIELPLDHCESNAFGGDCEACYSGDDYRIDRPPDIVEVQILGTQLFREVCVVLVVKLAAVGSSKDAS